MTSETRVTTEAAEDHKLDLEARRIEADLQIRRGELEEKRAQRESDQRRYERDAELKRFELTIAAGRGIKFTTPQATVAAAALALVSAGIGATIQAWSARDVEASKSLALIEIERVKADANIALENQKQIAAERLDRAKFETTLILKATESPKREDQIRNLKFFLKAGFINDPGDKIAQMEESELPSSPSPSVNGSNFSTPLFLSRFADPVYYITKPLKWSPNADQESKYRPVEIPAGFVFTFESIPQAFWAAIRPDGEYAYAAIIHEYLYWTQTTSRVVADETFRNVMQDFAVDPKVNQTLYQAVRAFGQAAWDENAKLKRSGEKRILKEYPADPKIRWSDYKKRPEVFQ
jgi:hypothetical protein